MGRWEETIKGRISKEGKVTALHKVFLASVLL
jgi:hypothetical protein